MGTISLTLPSDGTTIDASDVNNPFNTIAGVINGNIDSANVSAGGLTPANLVTGTGTSWVWQSWVPTLTNLTLGNGTSTAAYTQIGKTVHFRWLFLLGSTSAVGTAPTFTLPVNLNAAYNVSDRTTDGFTTLVDSAAALYPAFLYVPGTTGTLLGIRLSNTAGTYAVSADITSTVPFTWGTGDFIFATGVYETV